MTSEDCHGVLFVFFILLACWIQWKWFNDAFAITPFTPKLNEIPVFILVDDITLTVDGKDTYDEVKRMGRYR